MPRHDHKKGNVVHAAIPTPSANHPEPRAEPTQRSIAAASRFASQGDTWTTVAASGSPNWAGSQLTAAIAVRAVNGTMEEAKKNAISAAKVRTASGG